MTPTTFPTTGSQFDAELDDGFIYKGWEYVIQRDHSRVMPEYDAVAYRADERPVILPWRDVAGWKQRHFVAMVEIGLDRLTRVVRTLTGSGGYLDPEQVDAVFVPYAMGAVA